MGDEDFAGLGLTEDPSPDVYSEPPDIGAQQFALAGVDATLATQAGAADPQMLSNQVAVLYEGAAALATSLDDPSPFAHAQAAAETLIDQALA